MATHRNFLKKLTAFLGTVEYENITADDWRRWLVSLENMALNSRRNAWSAMRKISAWAEREFGYKRADSIACPPPGQALVVPLTPEEVKKVLRCCEKATDGRKRQTGLRDKALVLLILDTFLRVSEVSRLVMSDVNMENGEVSVRPYLSGRKSRRRTVFLGKGAKKALWLYLAHRGDVGPKEPLFVTLQDRPMDRNEIRKLFARIGKNAGVDLHPHKLRHTGAIMFLRAGGSVFSLQRLLGHSDLAMTRHYVALAQSDDEAAHRQASPVDTWKF